MSEFHPYRIAKHTLHKSHPLMENPDSSDGEKSKKLQIHRGIRDGAEDLSAHSCRVRPFAVQGRADTNTMQRAGSAPNGMTGFSNSAAVGNAVLNDWLSKRFVSVFRRVGLKSG